MQFAGSGKQIPITSDEDKASLARIERLGAIRGPADKTRCALCGSPQTTTDEYGMKVRDNQTGKETRNAFHLCAPCVTVLENDMKALMKLGQQGTH